MMLCKKKIENLQFVQCVNIELIDSLKNNGTKYLLIFGNSYEENCNSKAFVFVDIATAGKHRGLSIIHIQHNLFHQSKLGQGFELQNTHVVFFKDPRDVMQVSTLNAQLGLGSELLDWYRDATFVPYGHLLIDFVVTNRRSSTLLYKHRIYSLKVLNPGPAEIVKSFGRLTQKISLLSRCSSHFPTNAKVFSFSPAQKILSGSCANV